MPIPNSATVAGRLTSGVDNLTGTSADEIFQVPSSNSNLSAADTITGNGGHDAMVFERTSDLGVNYVLMGNVTGIEEFEVTAASSVVVTLNDGLIDQADDDTLYITFDDDPLALDLRDVTNPDLGRVELWGTGPVQLYDVSNGQAVFVGEGAGGDVTGGSGHDTIGGGSGDDTLVGAAGNDSLTGGRGADSLAGGDDEDRLEGGAGNDTLSGGAGYDLLTGGAGTNQVTGGAQSDTFVVSSGETLTITDFDVADPFELIDLRGLDTSGMTIADNGGDTLITLPDEGTTIRLTGVSASSIDASAFIFTGDSRETMAQALSAVPDFEFTDAADNFSGNGADEVFEVKGQFSKLNTNDVFDGAGGIDTLRVWGTNRELSADRIPGISGIEIIDMSGADGQMTVQLTAAMLATSSTGTLTVRYDGGTINVQTGEIADAAAVILEGTGPVTLRDLDGQGVTISDYYDGTVFGQNKDDTVIGGARNDSISGSGGMDDLRGGGGENTLVGGDGNDTLTSSGSRDVLTGGGDVDRFVITSEAGGQSITITDFEGASVFEYIDLSDFAAFTFAEMTFSDQRGNAVVTLPDGTVLTLTGVASASLSEADFILPGQDAPQIFQLSARADNIVGGEGNDLIDWLGSVNQFDSSEDAINGRGGIDTLRVFGDSRLLGDGNLDALNRVEIIDLTNATGAHSITITEAMAQSSDTGSLTIRYGASTVDLNVGDLSTPDQVEIEGTGLVTLSSGTQGQKLTLGAAGANVQAGNDDTTIIGGSGDDTIAGDMGDDSLVGNGGNDDISGGEGDDYLSGGTRNDTLDGGEGNDTLMSGSGANTLTGGTGTDQFVIQNNAGGTVLTDYETDNYAERIDLTLASSATSIDDLTLTAEGSNVRVTGDGVNLLVRNASVDDLDASDFVFDGQDPLIFDIAAGATTAQLQEIFNGAPDGSTINLAAGTYVITDSLWIDRGNITIRGAGEGETVFRTEIPDGSAAPTILVQPEDVTHRMGMLGVELTEGSNQVQLPVFDQAALEAIDDTIDYTPFEVGDLVFLYQANDEDYLNASGNQNWNEPEASTQTEAESYYLREFRSRIVSIDENGVATLAEASPYTFQAGEAQVDKSPFLSDVTLSDFSIEGSWGDPDHYLFEDTMADWASIAALEFDGVRDSHLENITITNPAAHGFKWQRAHETTASNLTAYGAHNKDGASGYHFLLQESFANDLANLSSTYARHAVLFSAFNAEHYNNIHVSYTNRDINFHGSADDENTIVVDVMEQDYPEGVFPQWKAVHPGNPGEHPESDIEGNDVTFRNASTGERADELTGHVDGADVRLNNGSDLFIGQGGDDNVRGDGDNDTLLGDVGNDTLAGNEGRDSLGGGAGEDVLRGGNGTDTLRGGDGDDTLIGGQDADTLSGGDGADTFIRGPEDGTDVITDFQAELDGEVVVITSSGYLKFKHLVFEQNGDDVELLFGPAGKTIFKDMQISDLRPANFEFEKGKVNGQNVTLSGAEMFAVGTTGEDTFNVSRPHMDDPDFALRGGKGLDTVVISQSSLYGDLGATGDYRGIEAFDLSNIGTIGISIEDALTQQSGNRKLLVKIGDTGSTIGLDAAQPTQKRKLIIEGAREVQLNGAREHKVYASDNVGGNIIGDSGADIIKGGDMDDVFYGGSGKDRLFGALGDDELYGDSGNDTLNARGGDDTLDGGAGADWMGGGGGSDFFKVDNRGDVMFEKEIWTGHDTAHVSVDGYVMTKNAYVEEVHLKGAGTLSITGNQADTRFIGNSQDNVIDGDRGADTIEGGGGADTFVFASKFGKKHVDTIVDFDSAEGDRIQLDDAIYTELSVGDLPGNAFRSGSDATKDTHRIVYDETTGELFYDADGVGGEDATLLAVFTNRPSLSQDDFDII